MRRYTIIFIALLSCLLTEAGLRADEQYLLRRLEVEDGLSQNMVYCICQDSREFMWFGTQDGINRYDGHSFKVYRNGEGLSNDGILAMEEATDGKLWIGTLMGLYIYDPEYDEFATACPEGKIRDIVFGNKGEAYVILDDKSVLRFSPELEMETAADFSQLEGAVVRSLCKDREGNIWAAGYSIGLVRLGTDSHTESCFYASGGRDLFTKVVSADAERLLVGSIDKGVLDFNLRTHTFSVLDGLDGENVNFIHDILCDRKGRIWLGAENGLFISDCGRITHLKHIPNNPYSLSDNAVFSIAEDCEGGIWIGTYFGGVNYYSEYHSQFRKYFPMPGYNGLKGKNISEFLETGDGYIWVGTEDAGLHRFCPATGESENSFIPANNVHALAELDGKLWVGTYGSGLYILDGRTRKHRNILFSRKGYSQMDDNIYTIFRDLQGNVYVGTDGGLFVFDIVRGQISAIEPELVRGTVNDICQDFYGNLWVSTSGSGIYRRNASDGSWASVATAPKYISCILEDSYHDLWFGTEDMGVLHYDHVRESFDKAYTRADGLPDDMVYMLLEDAEGFIWGSTNHGLFRMKPGEGKILSFDHNSGLICDQYNFRSGIRASDGSFYFGGVKGFIGFSPENILWPQGRSKIVFNRFLLHNKEVNVRSENSPLKKDIVYSNRIVIKPKQSIFSIGFADLNYPLSGVRNYQYRLVGLDDTWYDAGKSRLLTFSELHQGKYTLEVRADNYTSDSEEEPCSIMIQVLPPWYSTWWAYLLYLIFAIGVGGGAMLISVRSARKKNADLLEKMEMKKEKELYDSKIGFFTNITHEIRTPLTLITAPLDEIMEKVQPESPIYEDLFIVRKNADRLLRLVNELLDFRKMESGNILPNFSASDLVPLVNDILCRFTMRIEASGLRLMRDFPQTLEADIDTEIFTKILSNILSNACKHARSLIKMTMKSDGSMFSIYVLNDGDRIADRDSERIFESFVKLDENIPGSGIGLPFAKSLAATHGGRLFLDTSREMTCFVLQMPLCQERAVHIGDNMEFNLERGQVWEDADGRYRILVVDDNEDFRNFLSRKIGEKYNVATAANGQEAYSFLSNHITDLVVTDLMMPGIDGSSLCSTIKEDITTSHIPVILVTAKSDMQTKMECIRRGADDFISKPFQTSYLMVRIENLLKARDTLRKTFCSSPEFTITSIATSKTDEEFIRRLKDLVESRIDDQALDVDILAKEMNMSRATFYRKMKGVTDISPNDFIRLCRLKKAASILETGCDTVNEVAYSVGFSSPGYFSRCFSKQFGVSPKEYAAKVSSKD